MSVVLFISVDLLVQMYMEKVGWRKCRKIFLEAFFPIQENVSAEIFVVIVRGIRITMCNLH